MIRKIAQAQGRDAAYRMMAIGMMSNHLLSDHIQEEIKNAAERQQNKETGEVTDGNDTHVAALAPDVGQTTEKTREIGELQAGGPMREWEAMEHAPAAGEASSWFPTVTAPASDTCQTNVTVDAPPALSITGRARETEDSELQAGGPEQAPAAGEASSRFPTVTAPADTCQTLDETGKFVRARVNPFLWSPLLFFMYMTVGIVSNQLLEQDEKVAERQQVTDQAGGSGEHAPAAGEASSWFPTETAPAETFNETVKAEAQNTDIGTIENENDANKTVLSDTCQATEDTWEVGELQAGGSVEQAPAAGEASSRFPTVTAPADTCQTFDETGKVNESGSGCGMFSDIVHSLATSSTENKIDANTILADWVPAGEANSRLPTGTASADINDQKKEATPQLQVGTYAIVRKLEKTQYLNGMTGKILGYDSTSGRYGVLLTMALIEPNGGVLANRRAIKATNLEAVIPGDEEKWTDIMIEDAEEWAEFMEREGTMWYDVDAPEPWEKLYYGEALPTDFENPHFRRLASKLLKAGIHLGVPELMDKVSSYIHQARKNEAVEIMEKQDARTITRGETWQRIMADPELLEHIGTWL